VRAVEDPAVLDLLARRQVCLDVCPTSNVLLGVVDSLEQHPQPALLEAGVPVTLGSDCPLFCGTGVVDEYARVQDWLGLPRVEVARIAETSLRFSALPADRLAPALERLEAWVGTG